MTKTELTSTPASQRGRLPLRARLAVETGTAVSRLSRRFGGGGSTVGGRAMLMVDPQALSRLSSGRRVVLVSGTNGKTTTTSLLAHAMGSLGPVLTNLLGANLPQGIAAALAAGSPGGVAALEVDEAWLGHVAAKVDPEVIVLLNLSRDQLDRNNEVRYLAGAWRAFLAGMSASVVANADDPLVAWAAGLAERVRWVGAGQPWTADAAGCPKCGGRVEFPRDPRAGGPSDDAILASGPAGAGWRCSVCDLRRPALDLWPERVGTECAAVSQHWRQPLRLTLPGRANLSNATMALAAASLLGVEPAAAAAGMATTREVAGRYHRFEVGGARCRLLLAKNPAGWLEVLDVLAPPPAPVVVAINARLADGRDPSWLWDVEFERLAGRLVIATGERSRDLAVRLHYASVEHLVEPDPWAALVAAAASLCQAPPPDGHSAVEVEVVANYTAFQSLRRCLR